MQSGERVENTLTFPWDFAGIFLFASKKKRAVRYQMCIINRYMRNVWSNLRWGFCLDKLLYEYHCKCNIENMY